eukprot:TRINITY_DN4829_c0_g1_i3.p1 TRINITY_DN4829_c0_g1~~TRINITY_DN4829_c0_g1_i3.p1  ORF type:complete len:754 (+),score=191.34 TRINITY_DN4829_c0_g1_i3:105-2366(+)
MRKNVSAPDLANDRMKEATSVADIQEIRGEGPERRVRRLGDVVIGKGEMGSALSVEDLHQETHLEKLSSWIPVNIPVLKWLPVYNWKEDFYYDTVGGATIALICLVQTLAHASIATTKVIQGPYCAFVPPLIYACLGTSPHASISSGAIAAILIADQLKFCKDEDQRTQLASFLALISGVMLVLMGLCRAAFAVRFLSASTLSGFVTGGSILIIEGQIKNLFGLDMPHTSGFKQTGQAIIEALPGTDLVSLFLGLFIIYALQLLMKVKKYCQKYPKPHPCWIKMCLLITEMKELSLVALGITVAYTIDMHPKLLVGNIPAGLPPMIVPWELEAPAQMIADGQLEGKSLKEFIMGGFFVALSSFLTTYATCKRQALLHGIPLDGGQEMFALGAAGIGGSFYGAFTPSGSLSRASLATELGVRTTFNGIMMVLVVGGSLLVLTPVLFYLPKCVLGAIIIRATWNLVDTGTFKTLLAAWKPHRHGGQRRDMVIWCAAFLLTVSCGVMEGIVGAVFISVVLLVKDSAMPRAITLCRLEHQTGVWRDAEVYHEGETYPGILVVEFRGPLSFASADHFQEELERKRTEYQSSEQLRVIVLCFSSVHELDPTALQALKDVLLAWRKNHISVIIAEAKSRVRLLIEEHFADWTKCKKGETPLLKQSRFMITLDAAVQEALTSRAFNGEAKAMNARRQSHQPSAFVNERTMKDKLMKKGGMPPGHSGSLEEPLLTSDRAERGMHFAGTVSEKPGRLGPQGLR